jgi:hypothetical protein
MTSDRELYEFASKRVRRRNRRWMLWALNLGVLILALAGLILARGSQAALTLFLGWGAIFVTHTIILAIAESTDGSIESEVRKMRRALADEPYEKPKKRLELGEDGELTEVEFEEAEYAKRNEVSYRR